MFINFKIKTTKDILQKEESFLFKEIFQKLVLYHKQRKKLNFYLYILKSIDHKIKVS